MKTSEETKKNEMKYECIQAAYAEAGDEIELFCLSDNKQDMNTTIMKTSTMTTKRILTVLTMRKVITMNTMMILIDRGTNNGTEKTFDHVFH